MPKNRFLAPKQTVFTLYGSHFGPVLKKKATVKVFSITVV